jgi:NADPH2:quinone reductase
MRAAVLHHFGDPVVEEFVEPQASDSLRVVEVQAAGLNPLDVAIAQGSVPRLAPRFPFVSGLEGIGQTDEGRVYFASAVAPFGSFAERTLVHPSELIRLAPDVPDATAIGLGVAGLAGWLALSWRAGIQAGDHVLVLGVGGAVGRIALQAARLLGAGRVVAASRSDAALRRALDLGADDVVRLAPASGRLESSIMSACQNRLDIVVDPVWGDSAGIAARALTRGGRLVQIGSAGGSAPDFEPAPMRSANASILAFSVFSTPMDVRAKAHARMCDAALDGTLIVDTETVELSAIGDAFRRIREGAPTKLVVVP